MKKLYFSILLLFSFLVGIFHHEIIYSFHHSDHHINFIENNDLHSHHPEDNHEDILHDFEAHEEYNSNGIKSKIKGKLLKDVSNSGAQVLEFLQIKLTPVKNLLTKIPPPYYFRHIKNYAYSTKIKIIKSNT